ncbi:flippase [Methanococcoides methylutens]|uniref:flippase n=1 Tax=Methanococcoides methylutens TaxID=2226 RepID=UPI004044569B
MKDIQWSFISLAAASFSHFLLRIVLGKELGPSGLGLYTLVFTIYLFGMQFASFGIGTALIKYVAQHIDNQNIIKTFTSSGLFGSIIAGSVMGILLYILSEPISTLVFHIPEMEELLKLTSFCLPFISIQKVVTGTLTGLRQMRMYAFVNIIQNLAVMIVSIALVVLNQMGVKGAVIGFVAPTLVIGLLSLLTIKKYINIKYIDRAKTLKEISWFGFYIALTNSIGLINTQIDSLMIGYYLNETEVGYYAVAAILVQGLGLIPDSVQTITTASIATYYGKRDDGNIKKIIKNSMTKVLLITSFIFITLIVLGQPLIEIFFSKDFLLAYNPLLILMFGYLIYSPILSVNGTLSSIGKVNVMFKISLFSALFNTLLNICLVPRYGITGAATATSIALITTGAVTLFFINKHVRKIDFGKLS